MWRVTVAGAITSASAMARLRRPAATRRRTSISRGVKPSGERGAWAGSAFNCSRVASARTPVRTHSEPLVGVDRFLEQGVRPLVIAGSASFEEHLGVFVLAVRHVGRRIQLAVHLDCPLELLLGDVPAVEERRHHADVSRDGAVVIGGRAGGGVAAGEGGQEAVQDRAALSVAEQECRHAEVDDASQPIGIPGPACGLRHDLVQIRAGVILATLRGTEPSEIAGKGVDLGVLESESAVQGFLVGVRFTLGLRLRPAGGRA